jgi:hypothetical protein
MILGGYFDDTSTQVIVNFLEIVGNHWNSRYGAGFRNCMTTYDSSFGVDIKTEDWEDLKGVREFAKSLYSEFFSSENEVTYMDTIMKNHFSNISSFSENHREMCFYLICWFFYFEHIYQYCSWYFYIFKYGGAKNISAPKIAEFYRMFVASYNNVPYLKDVLSLVGWDGIS